MPEAERNEGAIGNGVAGALDAMLDPSKLVVIVVLMVRPACGMVGGACAAIEPETAVAGDGCPGWP